MKLSWNWLNTLVDTGVSVKQYAEDITMAGQKVETLTYWGRDIQKVVAGLIEAIEKHPDADRLRVCKINTGREAPLQIVTGAPNVQVGDMVPVALHGALLPDGKKIEKGKLRGVLSEGMLCSHQELGLTLHDVPYAPENGVLVLPQEIELTPGAARRVVPGEDIRPLVGLDDVTVEFEITNNRPDCLSVLGLARETAAMYGKPFAVPALPDRGACSTAAPELAIEVEDPALCPRYTGRMAEEVRIAPSPAWMRHRLHACGVRPINNIVDITNYVMLEYGQPMHAFDYACVGGGKIVVRRAKTDESMTTLDGQARNITPDMLMICDAEKPVGIAGVMGGENSEITERTQRIVFESACFNGPSVRKTALALGLRTDASGRFEKGLDRNNTVPAVQRACALVEQLGAGRVMPFIADVSAPTPAPRTLPLNPDAINRRLGTEIDGETMANILRSLGFAVEGDMAVVPSWRGDIENSDDLSEEIARIYGYDEIPVGLPGTAARGILTGVQQSRRRVHELCRALGFSEMLTYSFIGPSAYDRAGLPKDDSLRASLALLNPLGEDTSVMRTTMLPSALSALGNNASVRNPQAWLYELARVYLPRGDNALPCERETLVMAAYGGDMDFYALKGAAEELLALLRVENVVFRACGDNSSFHPGRCAAAHTPDGVCCAVLGELHPDVSEAYGITGRAYAMELDFDAALAVMSPEKPFAPLQRYPAIQRDLAVVCHEDITAQALTDAIRRGAGALLAECKLFDVYTGKQVPERHKSAAFSLLFRASDRTLTDGEVDALFDGALAALRADCGAVLRG